MRPAEVPGYAQAREHGLVRPTPSTSPPLLPGVSAVRSLLVMIGGATGAAIVTVILISAFKSVPGALRTVLQLSTAVGCFVCWLALQARLGRAVFAELDRGYTTLRLSYGGFSPKFRLASPMANRVPWDYRGVWMLDATTGRVTQEPDFTIDPPGFYPSPHRPGAFELWTGVKWTSDYRSLADQQRAMGSL